MVIRKLIWYGPGDVRLEKHETEAPVPGERQVLVRIKAVGICGTDLHIMKGSFPGANPPMILGHEIGGEVVAVGAGVTRVKAGDRVTVDSVVGCGDCELCRIGRTQFCASGFEFGINHDGACQDLLLAPELNAYRVPDGISDEESAVLDMEVWSAIKKCGVNAGERALILGAGPIGLIACQVARLLGAGHVTLSEKIVARLECAEKLGWADEYLPFDELAADAQAENRFDVVLECAGAGAASLLALKAVRPGGRVLLYGVHEEAIPEFELNQIILKDLTVFGALSDRKGWADVIAAVSEGKLNLKSLITHRFPLEEGAKAYAAVQNRTPGLIKAVLVF